MACSRRFSRTAESRSLVTTASARLSWACSAFTCKQPGREKQAVYDTVRATGICPASSWHLLFISVWRVLPSRFPSRGLPDGSTPPGVNAVNKAWPISTPPLSSPRPRPQGLAQCWGCDPTWPISVTPPPSIVIGWRGAHDPVASMKSRVLPLYRGLRTDFLFCPLDL